MLLTPVRAAEEAAPQPPPTLERIAPNTAPVGGGVEVTLYGSHFGTRDDQSVRVFFGGTESPKVVLESPHEATALVPPSPGAGPVDVELVNPGGQKAVLRQELCYDDGEIWLATWYRMKARATAWWLLLRQGGVIMLLLGGLSVFAVAWAVHCGCVVRTKHIMPRDFLDKLSGLISRGELKSAVELCQSDGCVFGRVAIAALRKAAEAPQKVRETAQAAGSREAAHLHQKISYLANVGVISPMLGLLGTVIGMILAFKTIGMGAAGGKHILLAAAIHQAMVTTAAGLTIGIPAMALYYLFRGRLLATITDMEQVTEEMAEAISAVGEEEE
jgi:biopolymer transport protein ExbB